MSFKNEIFKDDAVKKVIEKLDEEQAKYVKDAIEAWAIMWDEKVFSKMTDIISDKEKAKKFIDCLEDK